METAQFYCVRCVGSKLPKSGRLAVAPLLRPAAQALAVRRGQVVGYM
jgi:hypothetical protein